MSNIANFDYQYDYSPLILWQYNDAPKIKALIEKEQDFTDVAITQFKEEFDRNIFDLRTCDDNGLDLWGRILGVQRPVVSGTPFTTEQYRLLLQSRFTLLTWDGSCNGLTRILRNLFPDAIFSVTDNLDMTASIEFGSNLTEDVEAVLRLGYVDTLTGEYVYTFLPRPAAVKYNMFFYSDWHKIFGFEGMTEIEVIEGVPRLKDGSTTNMGGAYNCQPDDTEGTTGTENPDGGVFYE